MRSIASGLGVNLNPDDMFLVEPDITWKQHAPVYSDDHRNYLAFQRPFQQEKPETLDKHSRRIDGVMWLSRSAALDGIEINYVTHELLTGFLVDEQCVEAQNRFNTVTLKDTANGVRLEIAKDVLALAHNLDERQQATAILFFATRAVELFTTSQARKEIAMDEELREMLTEH